ncbi:MAG: Ldh family oxidoreductase [Planctomycetota bacterium]|nr:Ldh family oxidoreductase [Gemmatimonadota bacterium]MDA1027122.1 Ldh family oxidoreductase [Planctomycetota bacterium]
MNTPPDTYVRVDEARLLAFVTTCFEKVGLDPDHAALVGRYLVNSDLRGVRSHGSRAANGYCRVFEAGRLNPNPGIHVLRESPASVIVDGDGTLGYLPMTRAAEQAIAKAKEFGIAMGIARHHGHIGAAGHYARMAADAGCIGFCVQGRQHGHATRDAHGPKLGYFGNPPICFAFPRGQEPPVVLDAATCILADDQRGPEFEALFEQIPAAFFKSIGYTATATLIGGALAGIGLQSAREVERKWPAAASAGTILAIKVDHVIPEADFLAEADRMIREVRETYEPMPGTDRALLPGAVEEERMALHRAEGIRYGDREQESARELAARLDVPLPWDEG